MDERALPRHLRIGTVPTARNKTNAMRALDARKVPYVAYEYDPEIRTAAGVAEVLGVATRLVYKTLVLLREGGGLPMLVMVPGDREVTLRVLAKQVGAKAVRMAPKAEAEQLTRLQTGGIGALALIGKPFDVYIDGEALELESIIVNGGRRGCNLQLQVSDLIAITHATAVSTR
jgi:Cys-tRNA(Pro)/Cys-tRNA(Cys) deacylase